jgi:hypothetical protein
VTAPPSAHPPRIDGGQVLDEVETWLARFVAYPTEHALHAHAAWIAHAHAVGCFENTPRIAFLSPEPGSGKSRALEVTEPLVPAPLLTVNMSVSALFRSIAVPEGTPPPTVLFDEVDSVFTKRASESTEELRGMLNSGYRRGAVALRSVVHGKTIEVERSPTFCAVALAGLDDLPDTLMTRAVVVRMRRRSPGEKIEPYRRRVTDAESAVLRGRLAAWAEQEHAGLLDAWPELPATIADRNADVWEPLIAVADAAGGEWPERIRDAAVAMIAEQGNRPPTVGIRLLADIRKVFGSERTMRTTDLLDALASMDTAPWGGLLSGQPIDARYLARKLAKYDIRTNNTVRIGMDVFKGYQREHFADAWARYLPAEADTAATGAEPAAAAPAEPSLLDDEPF